MIVLVEAIDRMIKVEVNSEVHVEYLLNKVNKVVKPKPTLTTAHHPSEEPLLFNRDNQLAAIMCNFIYFLQLAIKEGWVRRHVGCLRHKN